MIISIYWFSFKVPLFVPGFNDTWILSTDFQNKNVEISNFMKIHAVVDELFCVEGRTDMTKLIVAFRNFAKSPKKKKGKQFGKETEIRKSENWLTLYFNSF